MCTNSAKNVYNNKKARTPEEAEKYFPGFLAFIDSQNSRYQDLWIRVEERYTIREEEKTYCKESDYG